MKAFLYISLDISHVSLSNHLMVIIDSIIIIRGEIIDAILVENLMLQILLPFHFSSPVLFTCLVTFSIQITNAIPSINLSNLNASLSAG